MSPRRVPAIAACLLFALAGSTAPALAGKVIYKWKDAQGGLHFSDTPPPAGATLISGPKVPAQAAAASAQEPASGCAPDVPPADCTKALESLQQDARELSAESQPADPTAREKAERDAAAAIARECGELRLLRSELERRRSGESTERLTDEERAALPASISEIESRIASLCN